MRRCKKIQYRSADEALEKLAYLRRLGRREQGTYLCEFCWRWHLTKKKGWLS